MPCPSCPHCIAQGAFGLIDPTDPALKMTKADQKKHGQWQKQVDGIFAARRMDEASKRKRDRAVLNDVGGRAGRVGPGAKVGRMRGE